jgi:hypothetical protein
METKQNKTKPSTAQPKSGYKAMSDFIIESLILGFLATRLLDKIVPTQLLQIRSLSSHFEWHMEY